jgi:hypothetical protein
MQVLFVMIQLKKLVLKKKNPTYLFIKAYLPTYAYLPN